MPIVFGLLGPLTVHDGRELCRISSPTHRLLLAHLLLFRNRPVSTDALLAVVWGEEPPRTASASLHNHVSRLRRALGPRLGERLRSTDSGYLLEVEDGELDSAVFTEHLRRAGAAHARRDWPVVRSEATAALALWRGGPPEGLALPEPETARLAELRLQGLEWRFDAELALGRHQGLTAELARLAAEHPLRESFHRQLMLALHRTGRRADALAAYQALRGTLVEELGIEPGEAVRAAHQEILAEDDVLAPVPDRPDALQPDAAQPGHDQSAAAVPLPVPSQLPAAPGDFTGRQGELDALALYLRPGDAAGPARVVIVTGMGGVGKTSLVVNAAHAVQADYPDGRLYADLHGFGTAEARTPHDLLGRFLTDLGVPGPTVPEHTDDRAAMYRALLAERRLLVVLDNARDSRQLAPLLPGSGRSAVIVTSRHKLPAVQCSTRVALGPLSAEEQHSLLTVMCGQERVAADPEAAGRIMAACAGLPLALRIAGSRLAHRPSWQLDELARRLARTSRLQALAVDHLAVREAFSFSYSSLLAGGRAVEREAARAFRLLGLWPGYQHTAESTAALLGATVDDTLDVLDALVDSHLLDVSGPGRYRFHDLLGEFAAERVEAEEPADERTAALARLLGWYTAAVAAANRVVMPQALRIPPLDTAEEFELPEFADEDAALDWCIEELPVIRAAIRRAGELGRPDIAWRLAAGLFGYGLTYWWNGEWTACLTEALESARAGEDVLGQAWLHGRLGVAHGLAQRNDLSLEHLRTALDCFRSVGDTASEKVVLANLASANQQKGDLDQARLYAEQAAELAARLRGPEPNATDLATLGGVLFESGDLAGAEQAYRKAVAGWRALGSRSQLALSLSNLGDSLRGLGRPEEALEALAEALEIRRDLGSHGFVADTLEAIARTHFEHGDPETARDYWQQTLELADRHGLDHYRRLSRKGLDAFAAGLSD